MVGHGEHGDGHDERGGGHGEHGVAAVKCAGWPWGETEAKRSRQRQGRMMVAEADAVSRTWQPPESHWMASFYISSRFALLRRVTACPCRLSSAPRRPLHPRCRLQRCTRSTQTRPGPWAPAHSVQSRPRPHTTSPTPLPANPRVLICESRPRPPAYKIATRPRRRYCPHCCPRRAQLLPQSGPRCKSLASPPGLVPNSSYRSWTSILAKGPLPAVTRGAQTTQTARTRPRSTAAG